MDKVGYIPILIYSSIEVPGAGFLIWASWDQNVRNFGAFNKDLETIDITLNDREAPLFFDFIFVELFEESQIPREPVFIAHFLVLERLGQIVFVRKVKAVS